MRMQKYCLLIFCLFFVSSCTTDLDVIEQRLDDLEKKDSLEIKDPSVFDVSFLASDNPLQLISDIKVRSSVIVLLNVGQITLWSLNCWFHI